jgi:hypothetical protein
MAPRIKPGAEEHRQLLRWQERSWHCPGIVQALSRQMRDAPPPRRLAQSTGCSRRA